jgi:hypothetical protein
MAPNTKKCSLVQNVCGALSAYTQIYDEKGNKPHKPPTILNREEPQAGTQEGLRRHWSEKKTAPQCYCP